MRFAGLLVLAAAGCTPAPVAPRGGSTPPSSARVASVDTSAPSGTVTISEGAAAVGSLRVTLGLSASDDTAVTGMCVSNVSTCTSWVAYASSFPWSLPSAGTKTVHVRFRDAAGNVSAVATDSVVVDLTPPSGGAVSVAGSDGALALSWSGFSDNGAGVASYLVVGSASASVAPTCGRAVPLYAGTSTSTELLGLTNGATYALRVCAVDGAGNVSAGVTTTGRPAPDYTPPSGTLVLAGGASWTTGRTVSASVSASGATDVTEVCVVDGTACLRWLPMADTVSVGMTLTQGVHTVRAWFRDAWGNVSATPATATIALDSVAPTGGTLTATGRDGAVDLSWSGFTDATSGVTSFVVAGAASATAPASCAVGTRLYAGTDARLAHSGLANGTTWSYRVCAVDAAGNTGAGVTATARPAPDYTAPTGTIVLAGGAAWTRSADVAVAMTATGSTDITDVCLSEMTTCTRWSPYAASTTLRLRPTAGTHTVRAWFRDAWGNVSSTPASDTIGLDRTAPAGRPVVTATPGAGRVTLAWSGFTDGTTGSGVTRYRVVASAGTRAPTSCTAGSVAYEGTAARATHRDAVVGTTYQYRVCAIDLVGNMGRGATASATVRTANQAPTAPDIALSSTTPAEGDALTCTVTTPATDADRDALSYVFSWDVDGEAFDGATVAADGLSSTVPAGVTAEGEAWTCAVAADDGATYGEAVEATGTVTSSAPTWTAIWTHALDALPADAMAMNGAWMGQGVTEVAGRTAWIQQSDWNVLYIPVLRSTTAFEAVEADVYVPSNAGFALYPLGAHHGYNGARDFLGFGGSGTSGTMGAAYGGWYDGYSSSAGIVDFATSLPGFSADAWHTVRVETDRTANESAFFLDGEEVLRTTTVPLGALADDVVQLREGTAAWASANVGWSNLVVYEGTP